MKTPFERLCREDTNAKPFFSYSHHRPTFNYLHPRRFMNNALKSRKMERRYENEQAIGERSTG